MLNTMWICLQTKYGITELVDIMKVYCAYFKMLIYGILRVFVQFMQSIIVVWGNVDRFQGSNNQHHSKIVDSYPFCGVVVFSLSLVQWIGLNVGIYFSESIKDLQLHMFYCQNYTNWDVGILEK